MKTRIVLFAAAFLVALVSAAGVACKNGSSGPLTLDDYLKRVDGLDEAAGNRFVDLQDQLGDSPGLSAVQGQYADAVDIIDDFRSGLRKLHPPEEAGTAHQELVDAASAYRDEFAGVFDAGAEATTLDEFRVATESETFTAANERFTQACAGLQQIADDNSIDISLDCGN